MVYVCPHLKNIEKTNKAKPGEMKNVKEKDVDVRTNSIYEPLSSLKTLSCAKGLGFSEPTPVQKHSIPILLEGNSLLVRAPTGTGKTLCFLLPLIERIKYSSLGIQICVISPVRELAMQIHTEALRVAEAKRLNVGCLVGAVHHKGTPYRADILVATPGRLHLMLRENKLSLARADYVVLDEADRLLDMGFEKDIKAIMSFVNPDAKRCLFSATYPRSLGGIINWFLPADRFVVEVQRETVATISQRIINAPDSGYEKKNAIVKKMLSECNFDCSWRRTGSEPDRVLIFVERKNTTEVVEAALRALGFNCAALHGDKPQDIRTRTLSHFRSGYTPILIATSVAARGLDIKGLKLVVNYEFPGDIQSYIHRIGRTGREGKEGEAVSFVDMHSMNPHLVEELIKVLNESGNEVPDFLRRPYERPRGHGRGAGQGGLARQVSSISLSGRREASPVPTPAVSLSEERAKKEPVDPSVLEKVDSDDEVPGQW